MKDSATLHGHEGEVTRTLYELYAAAGPEMARESEVDTVSPRAKIMRLLMLICFYNVGSNQQPTGGWEYDMIQMGS